MLSGTGLIVRGAVLFGFATCGAVAQPSSDNQAAGKGWDRIGQTPRTQSVTIRLRDGTALKGKIYEAGADGLTLMQGNAARQVSRTDIAEVTRSSRLKGAMWGAIIGTAISAPILVAKTGYIVDRNNPSIKERFAMVGLGTLLFGGTGAGLGAVSGASSVIYRAPTNPRPSEAERPGSAR